VPPKAEDGDALIKALRAVALTDTARGPFHFDHFGNVVGNIFIRRCERRGDKLVNTTIKTYNNVSQFSCHQLNLRKPNMPCEAMS
jgi:branched-chain amino acid transport system substrate-binding protein